MSINYGKAARKIIALQGADLKLPKSLLQSGKLGEGYDSEMEALHHKNARNWEQ
ncbi:MAG: hypothetical protein GYB31_18445 [Bacteroidetes bacterium]|nr:hypothetical protein [Bacteroidota bacterium]